MKLNITTVDYAPEDLYAQLPICVELIREIAGEDRPDYWIARADEQIKWNNRGTHQSVDYLVLCARYAGENIELCTDGLAIGIAYVLDESVLNDETLVFDKIQYVAIGLASKEDLNAGKRWASKDIAGYINAAFGLGKKRR